MNSLRNMRVAVLESRLGGELGELVRRLGGVPITAPAVREVPRLDEVVTFLDSLEIGRFSVVVLLTGAGATVLLREAERRGRLSEVIGALGRTTTVCRGPKPTAVLKRYGVQVHVAAAKPYTTKELLGALATVNVDGVDVALVHYGERNTVLSDALRARGSRLTEVCPYEWLLPADIEPLRTLVCDLVADRIDAVVFTSQVQCRHLFRIAGQMGVAKELTTALNGHAIVAAIGPVCAGALAEFGVTPDVLPADLKMGGLISALTDYVELRESSHPER